VSATNEHARATRCPAAHTVHAAHTASEVALHGTARYICRTPLVHSVQGVQPLLPGAGAKKPCAHAAHALRPLCAAYVPAAQAEHVLLPLAGAYEPTAQRVHAVLRKSEKVPPGHGEQAVVLA
jgi:hypothetical protein